MYAQSCITDGIPSYTGKTPPLMDRAMEQRKSLVDLDAEERHALREAFWQLQHTPATADQQVSVYDQFVALQQAAKHLVMVDVLAPHRAPIAAGIGPNHIGFLPWHRECLRRFERALQQMVPGAQLPYWDWTCDDSVIATNLEELLCSSATSPTVALATLPGQRHLPKPVFFLLTSRSEPQAQLAELTALHVEVPNIHHFYFFWARLVSGLELSQFETIAVSETTHGLVDGSIGGSLAPHDPLYWFHLAQLDRLWAMWQDNGHQGLSHYPHDTHYPWGAPIPPGHKLHDRMWPWIGHTSGYYPDVPKDVLDCLPDCPYEPPRFVKDTLSTRDMGHLGAYEYASPMNIVVSDE